MSRGTSLGILQKERKKERKRLVGKEGVGKNTAFNKDKGKGKE